MVGFLSHPPGGNIVLVMQNVNHMLVTDPQNLILICFIICMILYHMPMLRLSSVSVTNQEGLH